MEIANGSRTFTAQEIIARMMIPMVNEVARCLEEGIVASPAEADMALVYGLGFPPFHGGACRYLDTLGSRDYALQANALESLGVIYQIPDGLRLLAERNDSYYPPAAPHAGISLG